MRAGWAIFVALVLAGCSHAPSAPPPGRIAAPGTPASERTSLYEQIHSGLYQLDSAVKKIADASDTARNIQDKAKGQWLTDIKGFATALDNAGSALAEKAGGEPPTEDQVAKKAAQYETKRKELIDLINDVLGDMKEGENLASSIATTAPAELKQDGAHLDQVLLQLIDDLRGALSTLGGQEDGEGPPDTADTNQKPPSGYTG